VNRTCRYGEGGEGESVLIHETITISREELLKLANEGRVRIKYGTAFDHKEPHVLVLKVSKR
jgi:hypothetical protein